MDENFNPIRRYVYGMRNDGVKWHVEFSEAQGNVFDEAGLGWYSYIKDQVGTITQVYSRENYSMAETRTYDVFGNMVNKTGSSNCNLGFQGKYYDQESGLYYYYHRYYYPSIGRFINEDPIGLNGGLNMLNFVNNNPINFLDPFGLQFDPEEEEENIKGIPIPRPRSEGEIMYNNILIKSVINLSNDLTNPRLLCCLATCAGPEVTKRVVKEVMIHIIVEYIFNIGPMTPIVTLPITLHTGEKIMEKIMKCYIYDCAHLR